ncbi:MAG: tetratricopeptide repeat protein [Burkholderiales bacterium]
MNKYARKLRSGLPWVLAGWAVAASGQILEADCGKLANHYGPYDYRTATNRDIVENVHFTSKVESLRGGATSITAGGDINYTLRVFPNHHRALLAVTRLAEKEKRDPPRDVEFTIACWYQRAEAFAPDDGMVKALYGTYLVKQGQTEAGVAKLDAALALAGDNANVYYNLGLAYFDLKRYDSALANAQKAYALGFPLPGLRTKLQQVGMWKETAAAPDATPRPGAQLPAAEASSPATATPSLK